MRLLLYASVVFVSVQCTSGKNLQVSETNHKEIVSSLNREDYTNGETSKCFARNKGLVQFEVLPGIGWDNLRNSEESQLIQNNYTKCRTTGDGQFLIPDTVYTVPQKRSRLEQFAELFDHWQDFKSTTSSSINVNAGLNLKHFGISGGFSYEKESVRSKQVRDFSSTTRVQLRYVRYTAKLQPDAKLHESFKSRLLRIASFIQVNNTEMVTYESQLLVRDFGTHVITSVDAGALLVQTDQIKSTFSKSYSMDKSKVLASASASFMGVFHVSTSYSHSTSKETIDQYLGNRTHSVTSTFGGPPFKPDNFSIDNWVDEMSNNLVSVDKSGDPIYFLITPLALPELPTFTVYQLVLAVTRAVDEYYKQNIYRGCTNGDSPNFSYQANVDDGTCESPLTNYTFGGVYQTCERSGSISQNLCAGMEQKNPLTGKFSCPEGYESVHLASGSRSQSEVRRKCHRCWLFATCCHNEMYSGSAHYDAYWCVATGEVKQNNGYLFGGLYTSKVENLMTESHSCPLYFHPLKITDDLYVCVSDDYELGYEFSLPFAGFFSCISGNPLKLHSDEQLKHQKSNTLLLEAYLRSSGPPHWPRGCPSGYSQHLAVISNNCEINYCIESHALRAKRLPAIKRPPFNRIPSSGFVNDHSDFMISDDGLVWQTLDNVSEDDGGTKVPQTGGRDTRNGGLSKGGVAALSIFSTLAVVVFVLVVIRWMKGTKKESSLIPRSETEVLIPNHNGQYGTHSANENQTINEQC